MYMKKHRIPFFRAIVLGFLLIAFNSFAQQKPHLARNGKATQLIVDGKPFLVLGGELHNSSSSSSDYMETLWEPLKEMNLNTVLAAVSWQLLEPTEGKFDFSLVDEIINDARAHDLRIILLWFGSWKNGLSHYTPDWVKKDTDRFPPVVFDNGKSPEVISVLSEEAKQADAKAFAALMSHVKKVDENQHTVIMVQIENEVGLIGDTRDHSKVANKLFEKEVPAELIKGLKQHQNEIMPSLKEMLNKNRDHSAGSWAEMFGNTAAADEAFMAWHYANYLNTVAKAGKDEYDLPMFTNTWIVQPEDKKPGDYPTGGPQAHLLEIWRIGAPDIDFESPDVYLPNFKEIAEMYYHPDWNPLFIPESFMDIDGAANAFYAVGECNAIGYSPFGIDRNQKKPSTNILAKSYDILNQLMTAITSAQSRGEIRGISLSRSDSIKQFELGGYELTAILRTNWEGEFQTDKGFGIVINTGKDNFIIAGADISISFIPGGKGSEMAGLASVWEGRYVDGNWTPGRLLNGDDIMLSYDLFNEAEEDRTGTGAKLGPHPTILKVELYRY